MYNEPTHLLHNCRLHLTKDPDFQESCGKWET